MESQARFEERLWELQRQDADRYPHRPLDYAVYPIMRSGREAQSPPLIPYGLAFASEEAARTAMRMVADRIRAFGVNSDQSSTNGESA